LDFGEGISLSESKSAYMEILRHLLKLRIRMIRNAKYLN